MDDPDADRDERSPRRVWFVGDLTDPWVASIAEALPTGTTRVSCPGDLPEALAVPGSAVLVLHRSLLTRADAERLGRLRAGQTPPGRVVLCFGPHVRHVDLESWAPLVDASVPEATARETIAGHLGPTGGAGDPSGLVAGRRAPSRPRVSVVSSSAALRQALVEACEALGYVASAARDWSDAAPAGAAVWDVPVLEPGWPGELARRSRVGPVVALIGFADRALVAEARACGASACLELPFDLADLAAALDRLPAVRNEAAHAVPPAPAARRRAPAPRAVADAGRDT